MVSPRLLVACLSCRAHHGAPGARAGGLPARTCSCSSSDEERQASAKATRWLSSSCELACSSPTSAQLASSAIDAQAVAVVAALAVAVVAVACYPQRERLATQVNLFLVCLYAALCLSCLGARPASNFSLYVAQTQRRRSIMFAGAMHFSIDRCCCH